MCVAHSHLRKYIYVCMKSLRPSLIANEAEKKLSVRLNIFKGSSYTFSETT